jgi:hypothetical protein
MRRRKCADRSKPISTRGDFQISEILPRHAEVADKFSIVRSCYHTAAAVHDAGWQMLQTGRQFTGGVNYPACRRGRAVLRDDAAICPLTSCCPKRWDAAAATCPTDKRADSLGKAYDPFALMADPSQPNFKVPDLLPPSSLGDVRIDRRRRMREAIEGQDAQLEATESAKMLDKNFEAAYRLMNSPQAREAFDLSKEPWRSRERYGMNRFRPMLLAGAAVDRSGRSIRHDQYVLDRV